MLSWWRARNERTLAGEKTGWICMQIVLPSPPEWGWWWKCFNSPDTKWAKLVSFGFHWALNIMTWTLRVSLEWAYRSYQRATFCLYWSYISEDGRFWTQSAGGWGWAGDRGGLGWGVGNWAYILKAKKFAKPPFHSKKLQKKCVYPGVIFGPFGGNCGPFRVIFEPLWIILGHSRAILGHFGSFGVIFGPLWAQKIFWCKILYITSVQ